MENMKRAKLKGVMVVLAAMGMILPQSVLAAELAKPVISDVKLHQGGQLWGQVVDPQGVALAGETVKIWQNGREVAESKTNARGGFIFMQLQRGGVYHLTAAKGHGAYRVWSAAMAPPTAQEGVLLVAGQETVRGQGHLGRLGFWLSNPWVIAGIVATAVAVPVALHNADKGEPVSP
jgi:hypothetical protein